MCCEDKRLPSPVLAMLDEYRRLAAESDFDWGGEFEGIEGTTLRMLRWCDPAKLAAIQENPRAEAADASEDGAPFGVGAVVAGMTALLPDVLPPGLILVESDEVRVADPLPFVVRNRDLTVEVIDPGLRFGSTPFRTVRVEPTDPTVDFGGERRVVAHPVGSGTVRVRSDAVSRWTITDERGGAWFADGALPKFDGRGRPYFHAAEALLELPAGAATITVGRGTEFRAVTVVVEVVEGRSVDVDLAPERLYDPPSLGWFGGDTHVHLNLTGDLVCTPDQATMMQRGEGLHLMSLLAANASTSVVYDRALVEAMAGTTLDLEAGRMVTAFGYEYRNDLLGHFHATYPRTSPDSYQSGHSRSDAPYDWPSNAVALSAARALGATTGYTHPVMSTLPPDGSPAPIFEESRARAFPEARELVVDAALGLVDSLDLGGVNDLAGTELLYHRLLGAGQKLAVSAGTDSWLSHSRMMLFSNPPGWFRVYADLRGEDLGPEAWQRAIRERRTIVTNGPWLSLSADGARVGDSIDVSAGTTVMLTASWVGLGVETVQLVGAYGPIASIDVTGDEAGSIQAPLRVDESTWCAVVARGGSHDSVPGTSVYAHSSPIWLQVDDRPVRVAADLEWCLDWIDRLEALVRSAAVHDGERQLDDLAQDWRRARGHYRDHLAAIAAEGQ